ncbi:hypothetical protein [Streptomyces sp. CAI-85]|uniref:hypothetical protein n=1 Tax=Streptomyces sp. CAI-85 TaxID=1472662 RepID=UPI001587B0C7|nr:hypothetical protein [Streptomyces sp. CAI-85]NUV64294.1 hypothetical protein [Streptomyces sp. CAI-85]
MNRPEFAPVEPFAVYPSAASHATAMGGAVEARAVYTAPAPMPGAELVTVPGVGRVWAYTDPRPAPADPARQAEPLPMWVKAVALLMPSTACSVAVGAWGLSLAVGAFEAITAALWAAAGATAAVGAVVGVSAVAARSVRRGGGPVTATATATASGLFSKATATATATRK